MYTDLSRELWRNPAEAGRVMQVRYNLDFGAVSRAIIVPILIAGRAGSILSRVASPQPQDHPTNVLHSQFERVPIRRETYVYSLLTETADPGTQSGNKGPVHDVNPGRSGEEKVRLGEGGMARSRKGKLRYNASSSHANLSAYPVPAFSRTNEQTRTSTRPVSLMTVQKACV